MQGGEDTEGPGLGLILRIQRSIRLLIRQEVVSIAHRFIVGVNHLYYRMDLEANLIT